MSKGTKRSSEASRSQRYMLAALVVFVAIGVAAWYQISRSAPAAQPAMTVTPSGSPAAVPAPPANTQRPVPVFHPTAESAMPFPPTLDPSLYANPRVAEAYAVAREIPGVLAQQPCYCYCQTIGHGGLLDCFTSDHASVCSVCIDEAILAGQMTRQGRTPEEIRSTIIAGYERLYRQQQAQ